MEIKVPPLDGKSVENELGNRFNDVHDRIDAQTGFHINNT